MDIAIVLYDRFTALDAIGPYEVLSRLPGASVDVRRRRSRARCAPTTACSRCWPSARSTRSAARTSCSCPAARARSPRAPAARCCEWLRAAHETTHVDDVGVHRLADPRRRRPARRASARPRHWLALDELRAARRRAGVRARRVRRQDRHRGGRVGRHRHGADARGERSPGDEVAQAIQLGHRVRPAAAVRRGLARRRRRAEIVELLRAHSRFIMEEPVTAAAS